MKDWREASEGTDGKGERGKQEVDRYVNFGERLCAWRCHAGVTCALLTTPKRAKGGWWCVKWKTSSILWTAKTCECSGVVTYR